MSLCMDILIWIFWNLLFMFVMERGEATTVEHHHKNIFKMFSIFEEIFKGEGEINFFNKNIL